MAATFAFTFLGIAHQLDFTVVNTGSEEVTGKHKPRGIYWKTVGAGGWAS